MAHLRTLVIRAALCAAVMACEAPRDPVPSVTDNPAGDPITETDRLPFGMYLNNPPGANLRSLPTANGSEILAQVAHGEWVTVLGEGRSPNDSSFMYYRVQTEDGLEGWVYAGDDRDWLVEEDPVAEVPIVIALSTPVVTISRDSDGPIPATIVSPAHRPGYVDTDPDVLARQIMEAAVRTTENVFGAANVSVVLVDENDRPPTLDEAGAVLPTQISIRVDRQFVEPCVDGIPQNYCLEGTDLSDAGRIIDPQTGEILVISPIIAERLDMSISVRGVDGGPAPWNAESTLWPIEAGAPVPVTPAHVDRELGRLLASSPLLEGTEAGRLLAASRDREPTQPTSRLLRAELLAPLDAAIPNPLMINTIEVGEWVDAETRVSVANTSDELLRSIFEASLPPPQTTRFQVTAVEADQVYVTTGGRAEPRSRRAGIAGQLEFGMGMVEPDMTVEVLSARTQGRESTVIAGRRMDCWRYEVDLLARSESSEIDLVQTGLVCPELPFDGIAQLTGTFRANGANGVQADLHFSYQVTDFGRPR